MSALSLALVLVVAQVDGGVPDVPRVTRLTSGDYLFSEAAFRAVDNEMKRLQTVEKQSARSAPQESPWIQIVLVSALAGVLVGVPLGWFLGNLNHL